ncbi:MAG: tetratricopeptide repeat protein [Saprospiraceae bacterium]|nr:tetratricopeptide repeat protein [Saprospiraceae bacterium]
MIVKKEILRPFKQLSILLMILVSFASTQAFAQDAAPADATATSLYNEGLAALKEKDNENGYLKMVAAWEKAKEEKNDKVLSLAEKNGAIAAYKRGLDLLKDKNNDGALEVALKGLEINPKYSSLYMVKGKALEEKEDVAGAIDAMMMYASLAKEEADEKKVGDAFARSKNMLVRTYNDKKYEEVTKVGEVILENDKNADAAYLVGKAYDELGNKEKAIEKLNASIDISTAAGEAIDDKVYYALGLVYESAGIKDKAIEVLKKITDEKYKASAEYKVQQLGSN